MKIAKGVAIFFHAISPSFERVFMIVLVLFIVLMFVYLGVCMIYVCVCVGGYNIFG